MATAYSDEVAVGTYNRIRMRVEYSGTSASCYMEFRRTSSYTGSWADSQASITFNGSTISAPYSYSGTVGTSWVQLCGASGFTVPAGGGTFGWTFNNPGGSSVLGCSGSITISSQVSPPTGLSFEGCTAGPDWYDIGVSVSGWGTGGSSSQRYIEAQVWTRNDTALVEPRRYQQRSGVTSATIRVDNSSFGTLTIIPNTLYTVGIYATNGAASAGSLRIGNHCSAPPVVTIVENSVTESSITIGWSFGNQGGSYPLKVQISLEWAGGSVAWTTISTQSSSGAKSGTYSISGLDPNTTYTIKSQVTRDDNLEQALYTTTGNTLSVTTKSDVKLYGKNPSSNNVDLVPVTRNSVIGVNDSTAYNFVQDSTLGREVLHFAHTTTFPGIFMEVPVSKFDSTKNWAISVKYRMTSDVSATQYGGCGFRGRNAWEIMGTNNQTGIKVGNNADGAVNARAEFHVTNGWEIATIRIKKGAAEYSLYGNAGTGVTVMMGVNSALFGHQELWVSDIAVQEITDAEYDSVSFMPKFDEYTGVQGTKRILKLYGSVNGQTKAIKKLYGAVNGRTKLIFQE